MESGSSNKFQTIIMIVFGVAVVLAVIIFAGGGKKSSTDQALSGTVTVWGTFDYTMFMNALAPTLTQIGELQIAYEEFSPEIFENEFVNALASGKGPDVIILSSDDLVRQHDRLMPLSYANFPKTTFNDLYIESAQVFFAHDGVIGFPLFVDPLVLYYNKDLLTAQFMIDPPATWEEITEHIPDFTQKTDAGGIDKSAIALGTFKNIPYADDILSLLILQLGNPITTLTEEAMYDVIFKDELVAGTAPALNALQFFISFADRANTLYTWNTSLPSARDMFLAGDLAFFIGYASDYSDIRTKNPNLNFAVSIVPQVGTSDKKITYAHLYGAGVTRTTPNPTGAFAVVNALSSRDGGGALATAFHVPSVRRDIVGVPVDDTVMRVFYKSAVIARTWWKPGGMVTRDIFDTLITDAHAGRNSLNGLVNSAHDALQDAFKKYAPVVPEKQTEV